MKILTGIGLVACLGLWGIQPAAAASNDRQATPAPLQVQINIPAAWNAWLEDDITETFVAQVRETFRRRGYDGEVKEVDVFDEADPDAPLLTIDLIEWRVNHIGNIDCTFSASLQTPEAIRRFGVYTNTTMRWLQVPGRFGLSRSFEDAAEGGLRQLYDDIARTEMLPGLRKA